MRPSRITAALFSLLAILAIAPASRSAPSAGTATHPSHEQAGLEATSGLADSAALHTVAEFFTGRHVESARRLAGIRVQVQARVLMDAASAASSHTALLRLRAAGRDRRAIGDLLARNVSGAISFHTSTPPPNPSA